MNVGCLVLEYRLITSYINHTLVILTYIRPFRDEISNRNLVLAWLSKRAGHCDFSP